MNQSLIIAGIILFLFLVYVTSKGQLPAYLKILGVQSSKPQPTGKTGVSGPLSFGGSIETLPPITIQMTDPSQLGG